MSAPLRGLNIEHYKTQAKDLLKDVSTGSETAIARVIHHHPRVNVADRLKLSDAQLVIARENGFPSWPKFKAYVLFLNAVRALDDGDVRKLDALLTASPALIRYRCHVGAWYESGYFSGAGLLQHIAGNPNRCPLPVNVLEIAKLLLRHGANPNSLPLTTELLLTSRQASEAGVTLPLIEILLEAGSNFVLDLNDPSVLDDPIWNGGRAVAEELYRRGARLGIAQAAALGKVDVLSELLRVRKYDRDELENALIFATVQCEGEASQLLLMQGATGDIIPTPAYRGSGQATALHQAANRGCHRIVEMLVENGANVSVRDLTWDGTPADWAFHGGHHNLSALLRARE